MTLTFDGTRFIWEGGFETRHQPKAARFRWNPDRKLWWTDDTRKAATLAEFADDKAKAELGDIRAPGIDESRTLSRAKDADIEIPVNPGLAYRPFQRAGIAYGSVRSSVLIADDMGLGKTIQAIGLINVDPTINSALVICPASLKINWSRELEKWFVGDCVVHIASGKNGIKETQRFLSTPALDRKGRLNREQELANVARSRKMPTDQVSVGPDPAGVQVGRSCAPDVHPPTDPRQQVDQRLARGDRLVDSHDDVRTASQVAQYGGVGRQDDLDRRVVHVVVLNYDLLKAYHDVLRSVHWDMLIVDEAQYTKNGKTIRSQHVWGHRAKNAAGKWNQVVEAIPARRRVALTGTPIENRPIEIFAILHGLDSVAWPSFFGFAKKFCGAHKTRFGWDFTGATNMPELQDRLRATIMVRRLKADVLTELPPKVRQVIELPADSCRVVMTEEHEAYSAYEYKLEQLQAAIEEARASDDPDDYRQAVEALKKSVKVAFQDMSAVRCATAISKVPVLLKHLGTVLDDSTAPLVIFAHHRAVIDAIREGLVDAGHKCVVITGDTHTQMRQIAVDEFQAGSARVFIGNILAAGIGLTLTASSHVIFAELDWVPGKVTQAEDRCHRIGQLDSVLVQHLVLSGSLDAKMAKTIIEKQRVIEAALDTPRIAPPSPPTTPAAATQPKSTVDAQAIIDSVVALFQAAHGRGLAHPKIYVQLEKDGPVIRVKTLGNQSRTPGDLSIDDGAGFGGTWYGRVDMVTGQLHRRRELTDELLGMLETFCADPVKYSKLYGKLTGCCCYCSRELTDQRSVAEGYGPVCAAKNGMPWGSGTTQDVEVKLF